MNLVIQEYYLFMMRSSDMENLDTLIIGTSLAITIVVAILFILGEG
jgi:hypothetical protein|tara:strand:+ start:937 stop:1074 length:138 start_codon:yes stop_codon:yes gene_type:complete